MEEKKTLKIKKPYLIIFALAIAFAIMGFIDLKVNAVDGYAVNVQYIKHGYDGSGNEIETRATDLGSIVSTTPIDAYYYTSYDKPVATTHKYTVFLVNEQPMTDNDIQTTLNGTTVYICMFGPVNAGLYYDGGGYLEPLISGNRYSYDLNTDYSDISAFATALSSNTLDCEQIIDYSQLQTDDTIGTIEKPLMNIIINEVMENDLLGNATQKIYEVYNYVVWKNTENLDLQVEIAPFVNVNKGLFDKTFWKQIKGEWENFEIFPSGTTTMTQRSDMYYLEETNSEYIEFLNNVENEYGGLNKECELFFAYRFRYIDISTMRAGKWVYVVPSSNGYTSFTEYLDGTKSSYEKIDGVSVETENVEDVNNIKDNIDLENEFLEKYETTEIDVEDATNWLQSVASFIKGTPSFVGSVMSFLPEPIRYGMYVCLFLGVIASGYAIVKALI